VRRWSELGAPARRVAVLLAVGALVGAALVLAGAPAPGPSPSPAPARPPGTGPGAPGGTAVSFVDREGLTRWCRRELDPEASAEYLGRSWWCAGRPGGIWQLAPLEDGELCREVGPAGGRRMASERGVDCDG
jgi:hypothetical protein